MNHTYAFGVRKNTYGQGAVMFVQLWLLTTNEKGHIEQATFSINTYCNADMSSI
jgi:hypothetical protein